MTNETASRPDVSISDSGIFKAGLFIDNHHRRINYVRLSVTDRCNLRCVYCMPEEGIQFMPRKELMTYEEMLHLLHLLASQGITKVRITGGEPFVRKDLIHFLWNLSKIQGIQKIHLTTNGVLTEAYLPDLKKMGIAGINLSLDTLDRQRFYRLTRRDNFDRVMSCFHRILEYGIPLKLNTVVLEKHNIRDIIPLAYLTRDYPVSVRFIEEMPFNGTNRGKSRLTWNYRRILTLLKSEFPQIHQEPQEGNSTSMNYRIPGHQGSVGVIAGFTRTFCGTCNRIRINARGQVQTCLYGKSVLNVKELSRSQASNEEIIMAIREVIGKRFKDGWEAQQYHKIPGQISESMSTIGG